MKRQESKFFTAGEFAALCDTTKETLRHYNNIGVLKPETVEKNGYQYYSPMQFFDFYLISTLKRTGSPLLDIKSYLEHPDMNDFLQILYKQQQCLLQEKMMFERMEQLLRRSIENTELALSNESSFEQPELMACEEEYFIVVEVADGGVASDIDFVNRVCDHVHYCSQHDLGAEYQIGMIITKDDLVAGKYFERFYYSKISKPCKSERLFIKPKGNYVTILYKGEWNDLRAYPKLMDYIAQNDLDICGNAYEYELVGYLSTGDGKHYISKISVQVESGNV